jgi:hypothetical protein
MPNGSHATPRGERATTVYVLRDLHGQPLYVGITRTARGTSRFAEHAATKPWFTEVAKIDVTHYATATEAADAERLLIRHLRPPHNVAAQPVHPYERASTPAARPSPARSLGRAPMPDEVVSCLWEAGFDEDPALKAETEAALQGARVHCGLGVFYIVTRDEPSAHVVLHAVERWIVHIRSWFCDDDLNVGVAYAGDFHPLFDVDQAGADWDPLLEQTIAIDAQVAADMAAMDARLDAGQL